MAEWLSLDWWRYAWGPMLAAGLVWLASTWKTTGEARGARDARLDSRQDKEITRLGVEAEDARLDRDRNMGALMTVIEFAHEQRHLLLNVVARHESLKNFVKAYLSGVITKDVIEATLSADPLETDVPRVPSLKELGILDKD